MPGENELLSIKDHIMKLDSVLSLMAERNVDEAKNRRDSDKIFQNYSREVALNKTLKAAIDKHVAKERFEQDRYSVLDTKYNALEKTHSVLLKRQQKTEDKLHKIVKEHAVATIKLGEAEVELKKSRTEQCPCKLKENSSIETQTEVDVICKEDLGIKVHEAEMEIEILRAEQCSGKMKENESKATQTEILDIKLNKAELVKLKSEQCRCKMKESLSKGTQTDNILHDAINGLEIKNHITQDTHFSHIQNIFESFETHFTNHSQNGLNENTKATMNSFETLKIAVLDLIKRNETFKDNRELDMRLENDTIVYKNEELNQTAKNEFEKIDTVTNLQHQNDAISDQPVEVVHNVNIDGAVTLAENNSAAILHTQNNLEESEILDTNFDCHNSISDDPVEVHTPSEDSNKSVGTPSEHIANGFSSKNNIPIVDFANVSNGSQPCNDVGFSEDGVLDDWNNKLANSSIEDWIVDDMLDNMVKIPSLIKPFSPKKTVSKVHRGVQITPQIISASTKTSLEVITKRPQLLEKHSQTKWKKRERFTQTTSTSVCNGFTQTEETKILSESRVISTQTAIKVNDVITQTDELKTSRRPKISQQEAVAVLKRANYDVIITNGKLTKYKKRNTSDPENNGVLMKMLEMLMTNYNGLGMNKNKKLTAYETDSELSGYAHAASTDSGYTSDMRDWRLRRFEPYKRKIPQECLTEVKRSAVGSITGSDSVFSEPQKMFDGDDGTSKADDTDFSVEEEMINNILEEMRRMPCLLDGLPDSPISDEKSSKCNTEKLFTNKTFKKRLYPASKAPATDDSEIDKKIQSDSHPAMLSAFSNSDEDTISEPIVKFNSDETKFLNGELNEESGAGKITRKGRKNKKVKAMIDTDIFSSAEKFEKSTRTFKRSSILLKSTSQTKENCNVPKSNGHCSLKVINSKMDEDILQKTTKTFENVNKEVYSDIRGNDRLKSQDNFMEFDIKEIECKKMVSDGYKNAPMEMEDSQFVENYCDLEIVDSNQIDEETLLKITTNTLEMNENRAVDCKLVTTFGMYFLEDSKPVKNWSNHQNVHLDHINKVTVNNEDLEDPSMNKNRKVGDQTVGNKEVREDLVTNQTTKGCELVISDVINNAETDTESENFELNNQNNEISDKVFATGVDDFCDDQKLPDSSKLSKCDQPSATDSENYEIENSECDNLHNSKTGDEFEDLERISLHTSKMESDASRSISHHIEMRSDDIGDEVQEKNLHTSKVVDSVCVNLQAFEMITNKIVDSKCITTKISSHEDDDVSKVVLHKTYPELKTRVTQKTEDILKLLTPRVPDSSLIDLHANNTDTNFDSPASPDTESNIDNDSIINMDSSLNEEIGSFDSPASPDQTYNEANIDANNDIPNLQTLHSSKNPKKLIQVEKQLETEFKMADSGFKMVEQMSSEIIVLTPVPATTSKILPSTQFFHPNPSISPMQDLQTPTPTIKHNLSPSHIQKEFTKMKQLQREKKKTAGTHQQNDLTDVIKNAWAIAESRLKNIKLPTSPPTKTTGKRIAHTSKLEDDVDPAKRLKIDESVCRNTRSKAKLDSSRDDPPSVDVNEKLFSPEQKVLEEPRYKLPWKKARIMLRNLVQFPSIVTVVPYVVGKFRNLDEKTVACYLLREIVHDDGEPEPSKSQNPFEPLLTITQKTLLGLLLQLDNDRPVYILAFLTECEQRLLLHERNLDNLEKIARIYAAICKMRGEKRRLRRMVTDSLYYMGNYALPFTFYSLTSWLQVLQRNPKPVENEDNDLTVGGPLVKVLVQTVLTKPKLPPGFCGYILKSLLSSYYFYPNERFNEHQLFPEFLEGLIGDLQGEYEMAILILCKNSPTAWVCKQLKLVKELILIVNKKEIEVALVGLIAKIGLQFKDEDDEATGNVAALLEELRIERLRDDNQNS